MSADDYKRRAAAEAVKLVEPGMTLGLGTGSTAAHFIALLADRVLNGLSVCGVPTSEDTRRRATEAGIELIEPDETTAIDLAIDGADEADPRLNLIKGGGGALLREKIVAASARRFVVIADASKRVVELGAFPLPVEIDGFCWALTIQRVRETLTEFGFENARVELRGSEAGPFVSDGGHLILDCSLKRIHNPAGLERALGAIPGVVETGLFIGLAESAIFTGPDGVEIVAP
ncbi:MAG: ribose-5-phosphate isomerase RpiA [Parvularculaceae bacterium]